MYVGNKEVIITDGRGDRFPRIPRSLRRAYSTTRGTDSRLEKSHQRRLVDASKTEGIRVPILIIGVGLPN